MKFVCDGSGAFSPLTAKVSCILIDGSVVCKVAIVWDEKSTERVRNKNKEGDGDLEIKLKKGLKRVRECKRECKIERE